MASPNESPNEDPSSDASNYQAGLDAMHKQQWSTAADLFAFEPVESPHYASAMGNLAQMRIALDLYGNAAEASKKALAAVSRGDQILNPASLVQFKRNWAEILLEIGEAAAALEELDQTCDEADGLTKEYPALADSIRLQQAHAMAVRAQAHVHLGNMEQAVALFRVARDKYERRLKSAAPGGLPVVG